MTCRRGSALLCSLVVGVALLGGCAKKNSASQDESVPPSADALGGAGFSEMDKQDELDEIERELGDAEQRLRAAGIGLPRGSAALSAGGGDSAEDLEVVEAGRQQPATPSEESVAAQATSAEDSDAASRDESGEPAPQRCQNICDLSRSICDLEAHICSLAVRHTADSRYSQVCERASGDCRVAQEACDDCT